MAKRDPWGLQLASVVEVLFLEVLFVEVLFVEVLFVEVFVLEVCGMVAPCNDLTTCTTVAASGPTWRAVGRVTSLSLCLSWGGRRTGKSYLLTRFAQACRGVYVQATRQSEIEQRATLATALAARLNAPALARGAVLQTWEALFDLLTDAIGDEPFCLILDEFPYLAEAAPALPSIIQRYWDHTWKGTRLKLILSGSYISAMRRLEEADQPLYGRRDMRIRFSPFPARDVANFLPDWTARDRMAAYGMVGHLPGNLALVDPAASLADAAADLLLDPGGRLVDEAERLLDAFVPNATVHNSILQAIAIGDQTWQGIAKRVGKSGGSLIRPLTWLQEMGLVIRDVPITVSNPIRSKKVVYHIADPYVAFWYRAIAPLVRNGSIGLADPRLLWESGVSARLTQHMGQVFETICQQWVAAGNGPFQPIRVGRWWRDDDEIDIVATGANGELLVAECKWGTVKTADLHTLIRRSRLVASELTDVHKVHLLLFTGSGEADLGTRTAANTGEVTIVGPVALS